MFETEKDLERAAPNYYRRFLVPNRDRLMARAAIVQARRSDWWGLMRSRAFAFDTNPRIISKFFGAEGGFALDLDAKVLPVMGHAWIPKNVLIELDPEEFPTSEILSAYVALLNSSVFVKLLAYYAPHVAGGQYDVSSRHVGEIPMPDLRALCVGRRQGMWVRELSTQGKQINLSDPLWRDRTSQLVMDLYGTPALTSL